MKHDYKAALETHCFERDEWDDHAKAIRAALELAIQHEEDIACGRQIALDYFKVKENER